MPPLRRIPDASPALVPTLVPALVQGPFYLATGLWPLLHMRSFLSVTGPKHDLWLVKTVGGLIAVVGGALTLAGLRGRVGPETRLLALGSAVFLSAVDVVYVSQRRIPKVYLLDALAELGLIALWAGAQGSPQRSPHRALETSQIPRTRQSLEPGRH